MGLVYVGFYYASTFKLYWFRQSGNSNLPQPSSPKFVWGSPCIRLYSCWPRTGFTLECFNWIEYFKFPEDAFHWLRGGCFSSMPKCYALTGIHLYNTDVYVWQRQLRNHTVVSRRKTCTCIFGRVYGMCAIRAWILFAVSVSHQVNACVVPRL